MKPTFRVFVSAVSPELGNYRREVARVLRRKELEVREQEHFRQGGATLLEQLRDYIEHCDAVILLVGARCGALPSDEHTAALGDMACFDRYRTKMRQVRASYTQWEFFLAKQFGKKTYLFMTDETRLQPDHPNDESPELQACQQAYRDWLDTLGEHRDVLTTREKLIEDILVLPFPDLSRPKPIALPYASLGSLFKGRDEYLNLLRRSLETGGDGRATAIVGKALHGLGGVGKTRLAVEYAWRHLDDYDALLFVSADTPEILQRNLAALAEAEVLDLPEQTVPEEDVRYAATLSWLRQHPGWLLILDNLDTPRAAEAAEQLFSRLHGGHVLFTGRISNWSASVEALELDVLTLDDARAFLLERTNRGKARRKTPDDEAEARRVAEELGCLALALEQAAAYIVRQRLSFAEYRAAWESRRDTVLAWFDAREMQYHHSVAVTWQTSVDQLGEPARRLLHQLAWFAPEPIPESVLAVPIPETEETEFDLRDALTELEAYSLVSRAADSASFSVHRLVQEVTRRRLRDDAEQRALRVALSWIDTAFVGDPDDVRNWPILDPLAPHVSAVARHADRAGITEPTARLMNQLGLLLHTKALHRQAEPPMRRALAIDEQSYGPDHPTVASDLNNLALLLQATNRLSAAEPLMRRALAIDEQSYGPDHPNVAIRLNNLASLLYDTNRLSEAEPLMRRVVSIVQKSLGENHPNVATALNNLAQLLKATYRLSEAEPLMRRVVSIVQKSLGENHPNVATALNNLATLLKATNRLADAEPLMRQALAIDEQSYGPDHPNVARDLNNLARLLQATDRLSEAKPLGQRALRILLDCSRQIGHEHPKLRKALANYQGIQEALGHSNAEIRSAIDALSSEYGIELQ